MLGAPTDRTGPTRGGPGGRTTCRAERATPRIARTFERRAAGVADRPPRYGRPVGEPNVWSKARLADGDGRDADVDVNGFALLCTIPADAGLEPAGATPFGLLAASLSACTVMSVRTFLQRWRIEPGEVTVRVAVRAGAGAGGIETLLERHVTVDAQVGPDLGEQLSAEVDATPVTRLLRDAVPIRTVITTG